MANQSPEVTDYQAHADHERRIREKAYQLWQADGAPEGKAEYYWHRARQIIEAEENPGVSSEHS
jgi:hypothetical protein